MQHKVMHTKHTWSATASTRSSCTTPAKEERQRHAVRSPAVPSMVLLIFSHKHKLVGTPLDLG